MALKNLDMQIETGKKYSWCIYCYFIKEEGEVQCCDVNNTSERSNDFVCNDCREEIR